MAFLVILEQLTPVERAVLLLRGVFDYEYAEIAEMVGKSEANCRQIFHRAQSHVRSKRPRFDVAAETHAAMVTRFTQAVSAGELDGLVSLLTADVEFVADGGGKASAAVRPVRGADAVARFFLGLAAKGRDQVTVVTAPVNGQLGVILYDHAGQPVATFTFDVLSNAVGDLLIGHIYAVRNPNKLAGLPQHAD